MGNGSPVTHVFPRSSDIPLYSRHTDNAAGHYKTTMAELRTPNGYLSANELDGTFIKQLSMAEMGDFITDQRAADALSGEDVDLSKVFGALVLMPNHLLLLPPPESIGSKHFNQVFIPSLLLRGGVFLKEDYNGEFEIPKYGDKVIVTYKSMNDLTTGGIFLRPKFQGSISRGSLGKSGGSNSSNSNSRDSRRKKSAGGAGKSYYSACGKKSKCSKSIKDTKKSSNLSKQQQVANAKEKAKTKKQDNNKGTSLWNNLTEAGSKFVKKILPDTSSKKESPVVCKPYSSALGLSGINTSLRYEHYEPKNIRPRKRPPLSIVIHDTAGNSGTAKRVFKGLLNKGLSSHYIIDNDGQIWENADPGLSATRHGGSFNSYSIGIDLTCPVSLKLGGKSKNYEGGKYPYKNRIIQAPYHAVKNPDTKKQIIDYTPPQKKALARLVRALCNKYNIPKVGYAKVVWRRNASPDQLNPKSFRGVIGHMQYESNRSDGFNAVKVLEKQGVIKLS